MPGLLDYYQQSAVRARMLEFLGGPSVEAVSCVYLTASESSSAASFEALAPSGLWEYLARGAEVNRSLWDRRALIAHLDIEYVNFDFPGEPYLDPDRSFGVQAPVVRTLLAILLEYGIAPLHLLSGRGHHLVWQVPYDTPAMEHLIEVGVVGETLKHCNAAAHPPAGEPVDPRVGAGFAGVGQVLEYVAHRVLAEMPMVDGVPIELTAVQTAPAQRGCEVISLDLSEYGDPLHTRMIRIPYSAYHKPGQERRKLGEHVVAELPMIFMIPLFEMDHRQGTAVMRDADQVAQLARVASAAIPDCSAGMDRLTADYAESDVGAFHRQFYLQEHEPAWRWPRTYDRTPLAPLPRCTRAMLQHPNDVLLTPAGIRHVVRVFLSLGWHPRHIAGLIRSKFERDHGWGAYFYHYDAATRADFYVRLFAGLVATGRDPLDDFHCPAVPTHPPCNGTTCAEILERYRQSLLARRSHERLACRPIHGLFLPDEHP